MALTFAPGIEQFVVELLSKLFASVPDSVLLPWLPNLILSLRSQEGIWRSLILATAASFPKQLSDFEQRQPSWQSSVPVIAEVIPNQKLSQEIQVRHLLLNAKATTDAMAKKLGINVSTWEEELDKIGSEACASTHDRVII